MNTFQTVFAWLKNDSIFRIKLTSDAQAVLSELLTMAANKFKQYTYVEYNDYKVEEEEAYSIEQFWNLPSTIQETLIPVNAETIDNAEVEMNDIKAFIFPYKMNEEQYFAFQAPRKETKTLRSGLKLFHDIDTYKIDNRNIITITGDIDCIAVNGALRFHSEYFARQIFPLSDYYREATDEDVSAFITSLDLSFEDGESFATMSQDRIMRTKIAALLDRGFFTRFSADDIQQKARSVIPSINCIRDGKIYFPNNKASCKRLLKLFCDEIYQGIFSSEVFETNSKRKITI